MAHSLVSSMGSVGRRGWVIAVNFVMFLTAGCVAPGPRGELPMGCWSGEGSFVYETWPAATTQPTEPSAEPQSLSSEYKTTLCIRPARLEGREVIEMDIRSLRGPFPGSKDLGDETRLRVALVKAKRVSDSTALYRIAALQFNPSPGEELKSDQNASPFAASCVTTGGRTVFQIQYMSDFVDTFSFEGQRLDKSGALYDKAGGLIHWVETLQRCGSLGGAACCEKPPPAAPKVNP